MSWEMVEKFITEYQEAWNHAGQAMSALQSALRDLSATEAARKGNVAKTKKISVAFEIDAAPVSLVEWNKYMGTSFMNVKADAFGHARGMSWYEADAFCKVVGSRLPTEQEWVVSVEEWYGCWEWTSTKIENQYIARGGVWNGLVMLLRVAYRNILPPDVHPDNFGFRCVREEK